MAGKQDGPDPRLPSLVAVVVSTVVGGEVFVRGVVFVFLDVEGVDGPGN